MIDASEAISYLVGSSGNAKLAASRASSEKGEPITEAHLLMAVSADPTAVVVLASQARTLLLLRTLDTLRVTEMAYLEALDGLSSKDTASAYVNLIKAVGLMLTDAPQPQQNNTLPAILAGLPPQIRESVQFLITAHSQEEPTSEGAPPITQPRVKEAEVVKDPAPAGHPYEEARVEREETFADETLAQERELGMLGIRAA